MTTPSEWLVLIVEDEVDARDVVAKLLAKSQIATHSVATAEEALELLAEYQYNGVIIDLALPGMDGWDLLKAIRSDEAIAHLPCFAITAYYNSSVRHQAEQLGFDLYFPKPLSHRTFVSDVVAAISSAQQTN
ncbi:MAG: response regulator [Chloroflexi bacterium]|nr:response regulator [Chloroflexota bacterium]